MNEFRTKLSINEQLHQFRSTPFISFVIANSSRSGLINSKRVQLATSLGCVHAPALFAIAVDRIPGYLAPAPDVGITIVSSRFTDLDYTDDAFVLHYSWIETSGSVV